MSEKDKPRVPPPEKRPIGETKPSDKRTFRESDSKEAKRGGYVQKADPGGDKPPLPKK